VPAASTSGAWTIDATGRVQLDGVALPDGWTLEQARSRFGSLESWDGGAFPSTVHRSSAGLTFSARDGRRVDGINFYLGPRSGAFQPDTRFGGSLVLDGFEVGGGEPRTSDALQARSTGLKWALIPVGAYARIEGSGAASVSVLRNVDDPAEPFPIRLVQISLCRGADPRSPCD
jgi:hypothetical protein